MTQNQIEILLADLSGRLPYGPKIECIDVHPHRFTTTLSPEIIDEMIHDKCYWEYKPYLIPMSKMCADVSCEFDRIVRMDADVTDVSMALIELFNKNHIDYRDLIGKDMAFDATLFDKIY